MNEKEEQIYLMGGRSAWIRLLRLSLTELGIGNEDADRARWALEKAEIIQTLSARNPEVDWSDGYLPDLINKNLPRD